MKVPDEVAMLALVRLRVELYACAQRLEGARRLEFVALLREVLGVVDVAEVSS